MISDFNSKPYKSTVSLFNSKGFLCYLTFYVNSLCFGVRDGERERKRERAFHRTLLAFNHVVWEAMTIY